jgi:adenylate cyclase
MTTSRSHAEYLGFRDQPTAANAADTTALPVSVLDQPLPAGAAPNPRRPGSDPERLDVQLLLAVSQAMALETSLRALLQQALRLTLARSQATSGSILVLNERGAVLEGCLMHNGAINALPPAGNSELVERGLAGWVVRNRRPALVASTRDDPRWLRRAWERLEGKARSAMCVPLLVHGRAIGVLTLAHDQPGQFTQRDLDRLARLAAAVS